MAPPKTKSGLSIREYHSSTDEASSDNEPERKQRLTNKKPSKLPTAVSRHGSGKHSDKSDNESKRNHSKLENKDSGIYLQDERCNDGPSCLQKPVRKVKESTPRNKTQVRPWSPSQKETSRTPKKLVPRETKASALRKQLQTASLDKTKVKSGAKSPSFTSDKRSHTQVPNDGSQIGGKLVQQCASSDQDESVSDTTSPRKKVASPRETTLEDLSSNHDEASNDSERVDRLSDDVSCGFNTEDEEISELPSDCHDDVMCIELADDSETVKRGDRLQRQKTTASVSTALEGSLNHHGQISAGNECGENNEYNTEDEEVSQLPPDCDNEEMYLESVDFKHPSLNEDHGENTISPRGIVRDHSLKKGHNISADNSKRNGDEKGSSPTCVKSDFNNEDEEVSELPSDYDDEDMYVESVELDASGEPNRDIFQDDGKHREMEQPFGNGTLEENSNKEDENESELNSANYSTESFEEASSSQEEKSPSVDSNMIPSAGENDGVVGGDNDGSSDRRHDDAETESDVSEIEEATTQCNGEESFEEKNDDLLARDAEKSQEESVFSDGELDSLDAILFGSLRQTKSQPTAPKQVTQIRVCNANPKIVMEIDKAKGDEKDAECRRNGPSCQKGESKGEDYDRRLLPPLRARGTVHFANEPEVFLVPFSSKETVCYSSDTEEQSPLERNKVSTVTSNADLKPCSESFADDLDDLLDEVQGEIDKDDCMQFEENHKIGTGKAGSESSRPLDENEVQPSKNTPADTERSVKPANANGEHLAQEPAFQSKDAAVNGTKHKGEESQCLKSELNCSKTEKMPKRTTSFTERTERSLLCGTAGAETEPAINSLPSTEAEAIAISEELEELLKLHSRIGALRKTFSGREEANVEKRVVTNSESRLKLLQNVKNIVSSIVEMSEDFKDGMQRVLDDSAMHNDSLHEGLIQMKEEYVQALDKQHDKIKSLTKEKEELMLQQEEALDEIKSLEKNNEELKIQVKERDQENTSIKYLMESTNKQNDKLCEQIDDLEEQLKISQTEINDLQREKDSMNDEFNRRRIIEERNYLQALEEKSFEINSLKDRIKELEIQLEKDDQERKKLECLMSSMDLEKAKVGKQVIDLEKELRSSLSMKNSIQSELEKGISTEIRKEKELVEMKDDMMKKVAHCEELEKALICVGEEKRKLDECVRSTEKAFNESQAGKEQLETQIKQLKKELKVLKKNSNTFSQGADLGHLREEVELLKGNLALKDRIQEVKDREAHGLAKFTNETKDSQTIQDKRLLKDSIQMGQQDDRDIRTLMETAKKHAQNTNEKLPERDTEQKGEKNREEEELLVSFKQCLLEIQQELEDTKIALREKEIALAYAENSFQMLVKSAKQSDLETEVTKELLLNVMREMKRLETLLNDNEEQKVARRLGQESRDLETEVTKELLLNVMREIKRLETLLHDNEDQKVARRLGQESREQTAPISNQHDAEKNQLKESLLEKEKKIEELENYAVNLKKELKEARVSVEKRDIELKQTTDLYENKNEELQKLKTRLHQNELESTQWKDVFKDREAKIAHENISLKEDVLRMELRLGEQDNKLERTNQWLQESRREMEILRRLVKNKDAKIVALESKLEKKEQDVIKANESLSFKMEEIKRLQCKLDDAIMEKYRLFTENKGMIRVVEDANRINAELKELRNGYRQKIFDEGIIRGHMKELGQEKEKLKRLLVDKEKKVGKLEKFVARFQNDFERICKCLRDKDKELKQGKEEKEKELHQMKSNLCQAVKEIKEWKTLSKDRECQMKEVNESLKENSKDLEAIVHRQQKDIQDWKSLLKKKDADLNQTSTALEESKKELDNVKCLLAEKIKEANGFKRKMDKRDQADKRISGNIENDLEETKLLQTELDDVKKTNMKLSAKNAVIEKRLKNMVAEAKEENKEWLAKLNNTLEHMRLQRSEIRELKGELKELRNGSNLAQEIKDKHQEHFSTVSMKKPSVITRSC